MGYFIDLALFSMIAVVTLLLGWRLRRPGEGILVATAIGLGTGLGSFSAITFVVSLFGIQFPVIIALWFCLMWGLGRTGGVAPLASARDALAGLRQLRGIKLLLVAYICLIFLSTLLPALAPPSGADYDSLVYHLAVPAQYLRHGRIVQLAYDHHSYFPLGTEMLYMFGLWLRGPVLAKLFHWFMLPLCCLALAAIGQRLGNLRSGLCAAAVFAALPIVQSEASTAYIELALSAYTLLAFLCFFLWLQHRQLRPLLYMAAFCGFCLASKALGVLPYALLAAAALAVMARSKKLQPVGMACVIVLPLVVGGGWYLRNWLWVGNPVFPFAYGLFGGRGWNAAMALAYTNDQMAYGFGRGPLDYLLLPWRLSMAPLNLDFKTLQPLGYWPISANVTSGGDGLFDVAPMVLQSIVGPALIALCAPLLVVPHKPRAVTFVLCSFFLFFLFWARTSQMVRYLLPSLAVLSIAAGWGFDFYLKRTAVLRWTTGLSFAAWALFAPMLRLRTISQAFPVLTGAQTPQQYLSRTFGAYDAMAWANANTPLPARFAIFGEPRCFYLDRDYFFADDANNNLIDYSKLTTGADLVQVLAGLGANYILWNCDLAHNGGFGSDPPHIQDARARGLVRLVYQSHSYRIYQLVAQAVAK